LADDAVHKDLVLTLRRGNSVAGKVTWPDGTPAADAQVIAVQPKEEPKQRSGRLGALHSSSRTAPDGSFTVSGLGSGAVSLIAKSSRAEAREPGDNPPTWTALLEGVQVGSSDAVLVLREPIGLAGRVVDDLGAPVKRFDVEAYAVRGPTQPMVVASAFDARKQTFETEDGAFLLGGLQPGTWQLRASAPGHVFQMSSPIVELPAAGPPLELVLVRAASIAGVVLDPTGSPVSGAQVKLALRDEVTFDDATGPHDAVADAKGAFVVDGLAPGASHLVASAEGFASSAPTTVDLVAAGRTEGVELRLRRGGRLTGEAFDAKGSHAVGRTVTAGMMMDDAEPRNARVDDQGLFEFENLAPGTYHVLLVPTTSQLPPGGADMQEIFSTMKMTSAQIAEGETTHVVLGAPPRAPVRLYGTVTRGGEPLKAGMLVCLGEGGGLLSKMKMATIRPSGEYEIRLDEPGRIVLSLQGGATSEFHATIPEVAEFRFDLEVPAGGLRGVVLGPEPKPAPGVRVTLLRASGGSFLSAMGGLGESVSDADGRFSFEGLAPGKYSIAAGGIAPGEQPQSSAESGRVVLTGLQVDRDRVLEGLEIRLGKPGGIAGLVRDGDGQPVSGATIFVRDGNGELLHAFSGVVTGTDGRFTYVGIADGTYTVSARTKTLASPESAAVLVRDGKSGEVDLALAPGTTLVVSIEDKDGTALRANFSVKDEHGREMAQMMDASGVEGVLLGGFSSTENRVGPLPAGEYKVSATSFDGRSASRTVKLRGQEERSVKLRLE
jgi:protocatechuate 3,4-dioxygenase beta subunit